MKSAFRRLLVLAAVVLSACGGEESPDAPPPETLSPGDSATYRVTFRTDWTQAAFATQFSVGRHFSGQVDATHDDRVAFWSEDEVASGRRKTTQAMGYRGSLLAFVHS